MSNLVLLDIEPPVASLTLNRPERHNSLVPSFLRELSSSLIKIHVDNRIKAVLLTAKGSSFSTGGDLRGFYENLDAIGDYASDIVYMLNQCILVMLRLPKPIITSVDGAVTGDSMGLILASDIVLVTPGASFTPYYSVVGFSPDGGWTVLLPTIIGTQHTKEIILRNLTITADQAVSWGVASELISSNNLEAHAVQLVQEIVEMDASSIAATKRVIYSSIEGIEVGLDEERKQFVQQIQMKGTQERMIKFMESM